jgi:hypothetical protein
MKFIIIKSKEFHFYVKIINLNLKITIENSLSSIRIMH